MPWWNWGWMRIDTMAEAGKAETEVFLALGSNMGDRRANIEVALEQIGKLWGTRLEKVSDIIESKAAEFDGGNFLNCCCRIVTTLEAERLLDEVKGIERQLGRENEGVKKDPQGRRIYSDRPIDIDILLYGDRKIYTEKLQIPHPRMNEREFVMVPLKQIIN